MGQSSDAVSTLKLTSERERLDVTKLGTTSGHECLVTWMASTNLLARGGGAVRGAPSHAFGQGIGEHVRRRTVRRRSGTGASARRARRAAQTPCPRSCATRAGAARGRRARAATRGRRQRAERPGPVVGDWEGVACVVALVAGAAAAGLAVAAEAVPAGTAGAARAGRAVGGWGVSVEAWGAAGLPVASVATAADTGWPAGAPPRRGACTDPRCGQSARGAGAAVAGWAAGQWGTAPAAARAVGRAERVGASVLSWWSSAVRSSRGDRGRQRPWWWCRGWASTR